MVDRILKEIAANSTKGSSKHGGKNPVRGAMSIKKCLDIHNHLLAHIDTTFDGGGSHVGQQHHFAGPRQFDELRVDRGLVLENIQPSTCDLA